MPPRLLLRFLSLLLLATISLVISIPMCGQNVAEQYLVSVANQERLARGAPLLQVDPDLSRIAQSALDRLVSGQGLQGQDGLLTRLNQGDNGFDRAAEIVATSFTVPGLQKVWMTSEKDRVSLLDPSFGVMGVAVVSDAGRLIAVEELGPRGEGPLRAELPNASLSSAEAFLFEAVGREREHSHLAALRWDEGLARAAAMHASEMASRRRISHQFEGERELSERGAQTGVRFTRIAENVAEAPSAAILHDAWMRSPGHRENILDPAVDSVGIAVVARDGQLYAVQDFAHITPNLTLEQQEASVGKVLDEEGVELVPGDADVRRACMADSGYAGSQAPAFIMRYTTDNLGKLPERLERTLRKGTYHRAAVGACPGREESSFTSYRIAVLLFP